MESFKSGKKLLPFFALLVIAIGISACGPENKELKFSQLESEDPSQVLSGSLLLKTLTWSTANGGLAYSMVPVGNGASFSIKVTRFSGVARNSEIRLNIADSSVDYQFVLNLFRGGTTVVTNPATGINSTVVLENYLSQSSGYTNPTVFGYSTNPFTHLNQFIASRI